MIGDAGFAARRAAARARLNAIDPAYQGSLAADPIRKGWFEAVYATAEGDPAQVPWADLKLHPLTAAWVAAQGGALQGLEVLDVGCGLGDNAEGFAAAGARVTAFDLVPAAVAWAQRRFPDTRVAYGAADLFALPAAWQRRFDLVHECYTLQSLAPDLQGKALAVLAGLLKPGGRLLIVARARDEDAPATSPPWKLARSFFAAADGLRVESVEDVEAEGGRHWRVVMGR